MAKSLLEQVRLPIDNLPDIALPDVLPLCGKKSDKSIKHHGKVLELLETWAKMHLKAMATWHGPNRDATMDLDNMSAEAKERMMKRVLDDFSEAHHIKIENHVKSQMDGLDLGEDDEIMLLEKETVRKKKRFFLSKRLFKWNPKPTEKEKEELQKAKLESFDQLKERFAKLLNVEVDRHKRNRDPTKAAGEQLTAGEETKWIEEMTHRLYVCHMAVKILGILLEEFKRHFKILSTEVNTDGCFEGDSAMVVQGRIEYLDTTKVLVLSFVSDLEDELLNKDPFSAWRVCVKRFKEIVWSKGEYETDEVTKKVLIFMFNLETIVHEVDNSPEEVAKNLTKSVSQRNLLLSTEDDNINLQDYNFYIDFFKETNTPSVIGAGEVPPKTHQSLLFPPVSTSGYGSDSHLSPATGDLSSKGRPDSLNLLDPLTGRPKPASKEEHPTEKMDPAKK